MRLAEPSTVDQYRLFLSSSNERPARRLRARVKRLVEDVICPEIQDEYPESRVSVFVDMWERTAAQKASGDVNAQFVDRVRRSHLTLVLILDELFPGTQEELEAAAAEGDVELSLLSFEPSRNADPKKTEKVEATLKRYEKTVLYKRVGKASSDDAWFELCRLLLAFVFAAMRKSDDRWPDRPPIEVR